MPFPRVHSPNGPHGTSLFWICTELYSILYDFQEHIERFGIKVVADLPVGDNLQDHVLMFLNAYTVNKSISLTIEQAEDTMSLIQYLALGKGPLATNALEAYGFYRSKAQPADDPRRYLQNGLYVNLPGNLSHVHEFMQGIFNLNDEQAEYWWDQYRKQPPNLHGLLVILGLMRAESRGTIRLKSGNPFHPPIIDPRYLSAESDIQHMLSGIREQQKLIHTKTFKAYGAEVIRDKPHPRCKHLEEDTDTYWRCIIKHEALTAYHPTSTCKMGPASDKTTVVNPQLR